MKIKALVRNLDVAVKGSKEVEITGIATDSRVVAPGNLFLARRGEKVSGADFIQNALHAGAAAIATDLYDPSCPVPQIILGRPEEWEARLANRFYGNPAKELFVIGITGTKGKTTTSYLVHHALERLKVPCGLIGTVETIVGNARRSSSLTTHFAAQNQKLLREMVDGGLAGVALEVSSHGLEQGRVEEIGFDAAVFTNLFPDHLDYHKSVDAYAAAKKRLFYLLDAGGKKKKRALINGDSPWADRMRDGIKSPIWTFGLEEGRDLQAKDISFEAGSVRFRAHFQGKSAPFHLKLMGKFNVYNALGAIGVCLEKGYALEAIADAMGDFAGAPGRLESVENRRGISVFVDYAHNGEALENVLKTVREASKGRIVCVFGCGGNRDPLRRIEMGRAADRWADVAIITSDNPRAEDPEAIIREILSSFTDRKKAHVEIDRKKAIWKAVEIAKEGDIVLIAGKGHEKVQIFAHQTVSFDDVAVAKEALI